MRTSCGFALLVALLCCGRQPPEADLQPHQGEAPEVVAPAPMPQLIPPTPISGTTAQGYPGADTDQHQGDVPLDAHQDDVDPQADSILSGLPSLAMDLPPAEPVVDAERFIDPLATLDHEELKSLGIDISQAPLVSTVEELLAAVAPDKTILLYEGTYSVPAEGWSKLEHTSNLTLVGLGDRQAHLLQPDETKWVLSFEAVRNLTFYNLHIGHPKPRFGPGINGRRKLHPPVGGTVRVTKGSDIRFVHVWMNYGAQAIELVGTRDFSIRDSVVSRCRKGFATMVNSTGVQVVATRWQHSQGLRRGFVLKNTELTVDGFFYKNEQGWDAELSLFDLDPTQDLSQLLTAATPQDLAPGLRGGSQVNLNNVLFADNTFTLLTSDPDKLHLKGSTPRDDFTLAAHHDQPAWSCNCSRYQTDAGYELTTSCHATPMSCSAETEAVTEGTAHALVASVSRTCTTVYAEHPGDTLGLRAQWVVGLRTSAHQAPAQPGLAAAQVDGDLAQGGVPGRQVLVGTCALGGHVTPSPRASALDLELLAPRSTAKSWASLQPIRAATSGRALRVTIPADGPAVAKYETEGKEPKFRAGDSRIPSSISALSPPYVVSKKGVLKAPDLKSAALFFTLVDGGWWTLTYPISVPRGPAVVTSGPPDARAAWRTRGKKRGLRKRSRLFKTLLALDGREYARTLVAMPGLTLRIHRMAGTFPGGGTQVASITANGLEFEYPGGMMATLDENDNIVQAFATGGGIDGGWITLIAVGDLDGDGFDEILWESGGIEDQSRMLSHLTTTKHTSTALFSSGH